MAGSTGSLHDYHRVHFASEILVETGQEKKWCISSGFTLVETSITLIILGTLLVVALPTYTELREGTHNSDALGDLQQISVEIGKFSLMNNGALPANLAEIGWVQTDPWGKEYRYTNFSTLIDDTLKRKNSNNSPVNSDYDLFSLGANGLSVLLLSAASSLDDIVRADNGAYIGKAEDL